MGFDPDCSGSHDRAVERVCSSWNPLGPGSWASPEGEVQTFLEPGALAHAILRRLSH